jgi:hypothetical protein
MTVEGRELLHFLYARAELLSRVVLPEIEATEARLNRGLVFNNGL